MPTKTASKSSGGATATASHSPRVKVRQTKMLIDGKWVDSTSGRTFETINPATGDVIAHVAEGEKRRRRQGREGRPQGVREGPVEEDERPRARPAASTSSPT